MVGKMTPRDLLDANLQLVKNAMKWSITKQDVPVFDDERLDPSSLRSGMKQKTSKHCREN